MAVELAVAYISLVPSMRGAQAAIARELNGPALTEGRSAGRLLGQGLEEGIAAGGVAAATQVRSHLTGALPRTSAEVREATAAAIGAAGAAGGAQAAAGFRDALGGSLPRTSAEIAGAAGRQAGMTWAERFRTGIATSRHAVFAEVAALRQEFTSQELTSVGMQSLAVGGVGLFGLFQAGKAAGDLSAAIATNEQVFDRSADAIERWSETSDRAFGLSQRAALESAASFAAFGKQAGLEGEQLNDFSTSLVELAGDLAAMKNTSVADALTALQSGLAGEQEPLRRYQVLLDDASLRQKALELDIIDTTKNALTPQQRVLAAHALIFERTTDAQGQFLREQDELGTSSAVLAAEWENTSAALGRSLLPAMVEGAQRGADMLDMFQSLPPEVQTSAVSLGALAAAGAVAVGGLSLAAGAVMKLQDASVRMRTAADGGSVALGRVAAGARLAGRALGAAGLVLAVVEIGQAINGATRDAVRLDTALKELGTARLDSDFAAGLREVADAQQTGWLDGPADLGKQLFSIGGDPAGEVAGVRWELDEIESTLARIRDTNPEELARAIEHFGQFEGDPFTLMQVNDVLDRYRANVEATAEANAKASTEQDEATAAAERQRAETEQAADAADELAAASTRLGARQRMLSFEFDASQAKVEGYRSAIARASQMDDLMGSAVASGRAFARFRDGFSVTAEEADTTATATDLVAAAVGRLRGEMSWADPATSRFAIGLGAAGAAADGFAKALESSSRLDDQIGSSLNLGTAYREFSRSFRRLPAEIDLVSASLGKYRPRQTEAIQNLLELGSASREYLAELIRSGASYAHVQTEAGRLRGEYERMLSQLGLNEQQMGRYIEILGLTPDQVTTAVSLSGVAQSRFEIETYLSLLEGRIPAELATAVTAQVAAGDLAGAAARLAAFAQTNPVPIEVTPEISGEKLAAEVPELELPPEWDVATAMLGGYTEAQMNAVDAVLEFGGAAQDVIANYLALAGGQDQARTAADRFRGALLGQLEELDASEEMMWQILEATGLLPDQVDMAITMAGFDRTVFEIETLLALVDGEMSTERRLEVAAAINAGDYTAARALIDEDIRNLTADPKVIEIQTQLTGELGGTMGGWLLGLGPAVPGSARSNVVDVDADTGPAENAVEAFIAGYVDPGAHIEVGADTDPAEAFMDAFEQDYLSPRRDVPIGLDLTGAVRDLARLEGTMGGWMLGMGAADPLRRAGGGLITGPGGRTSDSILAAVSNREYIVRAAAVDAVGVPFLDELNRSGRVPAFAGGGLVDVAGQLRARSDVRSDRISAGLTAAAQDLDVAPSRASGRPINFAPVYTKVEKAPTARDLVRGFRTELFLDPDLDELLG